MVSRIAQYTLDALDVPRIADFWSSALGLSIDKGEDGAAKLYPPPDAPTDVPTVWIQPADSGKVQKLRLHLDLRPVTGTDEQEIERLLALGAVRADVGQSGSESFVVLADPEGNEFCVLLRDPR